MATADHRNAHATCGVPDRAGARSATAAVVVANEHPFGPHAPAILATERPLARRERDRGWMRVLGRACRALG